MAKTEITQYKFTVKEGHPSESGGEAPTFLLCEATTQELSFLGSDGFLTIELNPGTSIDQAREIATYFEDNVTGIGVTTF